MWVEEDRCSPPLAMERESVLDRYFDDVTVERVNSDEQGWRTLTISRYFGVSDLFSSVTQNYQALGKVMNNW